MSECNQLKHAQTKHQACVCFSKVNNITMSFYTAITLKSVPMIFVTCAWVLFCRDYRIIRSHGATLDVSILTEIHCFECVNGRESESKQLGIN